MSAANFIGWLGATTLVVIVGSLLVLALVNYYEAMRMILTALFVLAAIGSAGLFVGDWLGWIK